MTDRSITLWRKVDDVFEWDFHISITLGDAETVVKNLKDQGVKQYTTYPIGDSVVELSSTFQEAGHD